MKRNTRHALTHQQKRTRNRRKTWTKAEEFLHRNERVMHEAKKQLVALKKALAELQKQADEAKAKEAQPAPLALPEHIEEATNEQASGK
jgi:hypothetical protein